MSRKSPAERKTPARSASLLREMPAEERPRERLLRYGAQALSDAELLAVLFRSGHARVSVLDLAREFLRDNGGLAGLVGTGATSLRCPGLGDVKIATLLAVVEIACRLAHGQVPDGEPLTRPDEVVRYLALRYSVKGQEVVGALFLDIHNRLLSEWEIFRGTLSRTAAEPRQVLKEALLRGAAGFVLFHTHPSGDPSPSTEDRVFTRRLAQASEVVGVRFVDHLILGGPQRWVSVLGHRAW